MTEQIKELVGPRGERKYVIVLKGYGPFVWQNQVMYKDSAERAFERVQKRYKNARLCSLEEVSNAS